MVGLAALVMLRQQVAATTPAAPSGRPRGGSPVLALHRGADTTSRRSVGWNAPTTTPNSSMSSLVTLRDRSRRAVRDDGYAKGAIDTLVTNVVGTGIKPLSKVVDRAFRERQQSLWTAWTDESDAEGQLDFYGQETQATRCWFEAGEVFARLRPRRLEDGLSVPLQLQVLEPEFCPHHYNTVLPNGHQVLNGIEFNLIGRRDAYWFYPARTGVGYTDFDMTRMVRVPARSVIHLYDPLRAGQRRGLPLLSPALVTFNELDKMDDATALRTQLANMLVGWMRKPDGLSGAAEEDVDLLTGRPRTEKNGKPMHKWEPGMFVELEPGEQVEWSDPPDPPQTYPDFMRQQLLRACRAVGVPYELLTGDMSKVNDRSLRAILGEFRRRIQQWQHQIIAFQFCRRVWSAWNDAAFLAGALPFPADYASADVRRVWTKVAWVPQGWPYIHPLQDVEAKTKEVRAGFTSRSEVVSDQGGDAEEVDREQQEDNQRADDLSLTYDSDARHDAQASTMPSEDPEPGQPEPPAPPTRL